MNEALKRAQKKYNAKTAQWHMRLNRETDADVIEWLNTQASASASVKALIRANIARKKAKN